MRSGVCQHVTGVVVNVRPNISRKTFDELKAIITNCVRHGPGLQNRSAHKDFRAHLLGRIAHLKSIHAERGERLLAIFAKIDWNEMKA